MSAKRCVLRVLAQTMHALLLSSVLLTHTFLPVSQAQITLDGSLGPRGALLGPRYYIGAEFGQLRGSNLFHSFGKFNVGTGESATFTGPNTVANIISRVTGGQLSSIDGQVRSEIMGANLFLLNPSGVMFGPNASLEVSGAFHVSTADVLRFADGATFSTNLSRESVLTVAHPAAFGFLSANPASITIRGSSLQVLAGQTLSVVGGDVDIAGQDLHPADGVSTLGAPGGRIHIASVAAAGEVPVNLPEFNVDAFGRLGRVALSQGALINASGNGGGVVLIRSGHLMIDGSSIFADNMGDVEGIGFGIDLRITGDAVLTRGAAITTDSEGVGRARDIQITAGSVFMTDTAQIRSLPFDLGDGGNVVIHTGHLTLTGGAQISSTTLGSGHGGALSVMATDTITITGFDIEGNPSGLFSNTFSRGDAGRVFVSAPTLRMDGGGIQAAALEESSGNAGDIEVRGARFTLNGGAQIDNSTRGPGRSGGVTAVATEVIAIAGSDSADNPSGFFGIAFDRGDAGRLSISAPTVSIDGGRIQSLTLSDGNAGSIALEVGRLTLTGGAQVSSSTRGLGRGGQVTVNATDAILVSGRDSAGIESAVFSQTFGPSDAGRVAVTTPHLTLADGGRISTSSFGPGSGGEVSIAATESISIAGRDSEGNASGLFSTADKGGRGGNLQVTAPQFHLSDGGTISAQSSGAGDAGNILIQAGQTFQSRHGAITTSAEQGDGGNIRLIAGSLVDLRDSQITATVESGVGTGGNITISTQSVVLNHSQIRADAFGGPGGNVRINAEVFLADPGSQVSAFSPVIEGTVDIRAPVTDISGTVVPLSQSFARAMELLRNRCAESVRQVAVSRFVLGGRDGVPPEPGSPLLSPPVRREPHATAGEARATGERRETGFVQAGGLERHTTDYLSIEGAQGQAQWLEALNEECARWRWTQGSNGKSRP